MLLAALIACAPAPGGASAFRIETLDQTIGGPKSLARPGDFMMENEHIRVAVLDARASMGPSPFGGTIVDVDLVRPDPKWAGGFGNDQFAELFPTVSMNITGADVAGEVSIVADGSDGGPAIVRVDASGEPLFSLLSALWVLVDQPSMRITTDYVLYPDARALQIRTTLSFTDAAVPFVEGTVLPGSDDTLPLLDQAITTGAAFGDFFLQGGSVDVFAPNIGFDEDGAVFEAGEAGANTFQDPFVFDFVAGVADRVSYGLAPDSGRLFVPLFTSSQTAAFGAGVEGDGSDGRFPAASAFTYVRWLAVGRGDVGSVVDAVLETRGDPRGEVRGHVVEEGTGVSLSGMSVLVFEPGEAAPWSQWRSDVGEDTQRDGSFGGWLPPGDWELQTHRQGRPDGPRVPVTVTADGRVDLVLAAPRAGQVVVDVVDEQNRPVPAKVTFIGEGALRPAFGDSYVPGGHSEVAFAPYGRAEVVLAPGEYVAIASRGLEYELGESAPFTVTDTGVNRLRLQVWRSVDTTGFVSADFHVHAINSFDSGTRLSDRVATMVCEGVEFFTSSDHDFLTDYGPVVEDLGLEEWVRTAVGLETTTLEIGHYIGFPLADDTLAASGGAFDWTGMPPAEVLGELRRMGDEAGFDPVRFVAHPRDGILGYFDQYGFDPITGDVNTPTLSYVNPLLHEEGFSLDFEALELLNGKRMDLVRTPTQPELDSAAAGAPPSNYAMVSRTGDEQAALIAGTYRLGYGHEGQVDDWFTLLNLGHRLTALGNSDTHGRFTIEAGCPRNYVAIDTDDPASIDPQAMADAVREGRVVATYGPFVRFWANDAEHGVGSELTDADGTVDLHVEVHAPTWMAVDRVELYQNGGLIHEWTTFEADTARLVADHPVALDRDSWFVVVAVGDDDLSPVFNPVEMPPVELQDVVTEALADVPAIGSFLSPAVPIPRTGPVVPFAITNPIRVDADGDGTWTPPGLAPWLLPPVEPGE